MFRAQKGLLVRIRTLVTIYLFIILGSHAQSGVGSKVDSLFDRSFYDEGRKIPHSLRRELREHFDKIDCSDGPVFFTLLYRISEAVGIDSVIVQGDVPSSIEVLFREHIAKRFSEVNWSSVLKSDENLVSSEYWLFQPVFIFRKECELNFKSKLKFFNSMGKAFEIPVEINERAYLLNPFGVFMYPRQH